jgi:hypothetical protein
MSLNEFFVKHAVPIVKNRIKDIIIGVAKEYSLQAYDVTAMLKMDGDGKLVIHTFANGKTLKKIPFDKLGGDIFGGVEDFIKKMFIRESRTFNTPCALVNYWFMIDKGSNEPIINVGIGSKWKGWTKIENIMFAVEIK